MRVRDDLHSYEVVWSVWMVHLPRCMSVTSDERLICTDTSPKRRLCIIPCRCVTAMEIHRGATARECFCIGTEQTIPRSKGHCMCTCHDSSRGQKGFGSMASCLSMCRTMLRISLHCRRDIQHRIELTGQCTWQVDVQSFYPQREITKNSCVFYHTFLFFFLLLKLN